MRAFLGAIFGWFLQVLIENAPKSSHLVFSTRLFFPVKAETPKNSKFLFFKLWRAVRAPKSHFPATDPPQKKRKIAVTETKPAKASMNPRKRTRSGQEHQSAERAVASASNNFRDFSQPLTVDSGTAKYFLMLRFARVSTAKYFRPLDYFVGCDRKLSNKNSVPPIC